MTNAAFKLEDAGFSREQVDALTEFMDGSVATKADIERLEGKIIGLDGNMKSDIQRLEGKIIELDGSMKSEIQRLEGKIIGLDGIMKSEIQRLEGKINLHSWMLGFIIAGIFSLIVKAFFV